MLEAILWLSRGVVFWLMSGLGMGFFTGCVVGFLFMLRPLRRLTAALDADEADAYENGYDDGYFECLVEHELADEWDEEEPPR